MATQYAGDPDSFPASFELPDDNDDLDAASVGVGLEALADRTQYLKRRFRTVADLAEMKAIGRDDRKNGDLVLVPLLGTYRYSDAYPRVEYGFWAVNADVPSADNPGYGQWRHVLFDAIRESEYGIVTRLPNGEPGIPNRTAQLVLEDGLVSPGIEYTAVSWTDTTVSASLPGLAIDDVVDVDVALGASGSVGAVSVAIRHFRILPSVTTWTEIPFTDIAFPHSGAPRLRGRVVVPEVSGSDAIVVRAMGDGSDGPTIAGAWQISATVYRPV